VPVGHALVSFFTSDDPDVVRRAAAGIAEASSGRVKTPEQLNRYAVPERGGLYCQIIFGPVEDNACSCGKLRGAEHAGTQCDICGVLCGDSRLRDERWGHIELPVPMLHPLLVDTIAATLHSDRQAISDVVRFRANLNDDGSVVRARRGDHLPTFEDEAEAERDARGPRFVAERLGAASDLMIARVPVTPASWRAPRGSENDAYARLIMRANRVARLCELNAPAMILENEQTQLQLAFERVWKTLRAELVARDRARNRPQLPDRARELHAAILADPAADELRAVYGDLLHQLDDPRGELIALQLANTSGRASRRETELLRRHAREWIHPLDAVLDDAFVFRRGFLAKCRTKKPAPPELAQLIGHEAWSTVEHLDTDVVELITDPGMRALRSLGVAFSTLRRLCARGTALPDIGRMNVRVTGTPPKGYADVAGSRSFPNLRELMFVNKSANAGADWRWLAAVPFVASVEHVTIVSHLDRMESVVASWCPLTLPARLTLSFGIKHFTIELHDGSAAVAISSAGLERLMMMQGEEYRGLIFAAIARAAADRARFVVQIPERAIEAEWFAPLRDRLRAMHASAELVAR
jgi:DNA-directed RNA polymerase subunit beta'